MEEALRALNHLVTSGVVSNYAIGGAVGAAFYIPAFQTEDLDAFLVLPPQPSGLLLLTPVYEALMALGGTLEREYVRFGAWPVQILTDASPLIAEAIRDAVEVDFQGVPARVFRPEHLCAIALQLGRAKDLARVSTFFEQDAVDKQALQDVLSRYDLLERFGSVHGR